MNLFSKNPFKDPKTYSLLLILINLLVFKNLLNNFFYRDDIYEILRATNLRQHISEIFSSAACRPLIFFINFKLFSFDPTGYYLFNIFLHILNTLLVYKFISLLLINKGFSKYKKTLPFITSLIFATNYSHHEAIIWITGVDELVKTFFYLSSLIFFTKLLSTQKIAYLFASLVCFVFSFLGKQTAISLPLIIFLTYFFIYYQRKSLEINNKKKISYLLIYFLVAIGFVLIYVNTFNFNINHNNYFRDLSFIKVIYYYVTDLLNSLLGLTDVMFYFTTSHLLFLDKIINWLKLARILVIVSSCLLFLQFILSYKIIKDNKETRTKFLKLILYGFLWMIVTFLPFALFLPELIPEKNHNPVSRYLYLPSIGFAFFTASIIFYLYECLQKINFNKFLVYILITAIVIINSLRTLEMETIYYDHSKDLKSLTYLAIKFKKDNYERLFIIDAPWLLKNLHKTALDYAVQLFIGKDFKVKWIKKKQLLEKIKNKNIKYANKSGFVEFKKWIILNKTKNYQKFILNN